jgi:hypothetical protein
MLKNYFDYDSLSSNGAQITLLNVTLKVDMGGIAAGTSFAKGVLDLEAGTIELTIAVDKTVSMSLVFG